MLALGIDVGVRKGLDLILLDGRRRVLADFQRHAVKKLAQAIRATAPDVVAIDSPPRPGTTGGSRTAERMLRAIGVQSFATPSDPKALAEPFYAWMLVGFEAFAVAANAGYPLFLQGPAVGGTSIEVFPHASAVALKGALPPRRLCRTRSRKRRWRAGVLEEHGIETEALRSVDQVDAALAALTGMLALEGRFTPVGDPAEGVIVLPGDAIVERIPRESEETPRPRARRR